MVQHIDAVFYVKQQWEQERLSEVEKKKKTH